MYICLFICLKKKKEGNVFLYDNSLTIGFNKNILEKKNEHRRFHTFVANRVSVIREYTSVSQWRYVNTKENPADDASRGLTVGDLVRGSRWIEGPSFLWKPETFWPQQIEDYGLTKEDPEVKMDVCANVTVVDEVNPIDRLLSYFSDWKKLKVAVSWFLKIKRLLLKLIKGPKEQPVAEVRVKAQFVNGDDLLEAETAIIRYVQHQHFTRKLRHCHPVDQLERRALFIGWTRSFKMDF